MGESRLPHNLQGLLRFCMQVGDNPPASADTAAMDPERVRWLREAMDSLTVDIGKQLRDNIAKLLQNADSAADGNAEAIEACLGCLEDTSELCDNLDVANDFVKLGGLDAAAYVCQRCDGRLRAASLHLLARLFQNNPFGQAAGSGCVRDLVCAVREGGSADVRFAALSALSCLVRDCPAAQASCDDADGFAAIAGCLRLVDSEVEDSAKLLRLRRKAAFLLASLAGEDSDSLLDRLAGGRAVGAALADSVAAEAETELADDEASSGAAEKLDWLEHALRCLLLLCQRRRRLLDDDIGNRRSRLVAGLECLLRDPRSEQLPEIGELATQLLMKMAKDEEAADR